MGTGKNRVTIGGQVSMRDIAKDAGVSVASVSYVVNGRTREIGEKTRKKILAAIKRMDYQPNQLMRAVRTRRSQTLGVLIPGFLTNYFPRIVNAVETALHEHGYHALICQTHSMTDVSEENISVLRMRRVDGIIATPKPDETPLYRRIFETGLKTVFIDSHLPAVPVSSVQSDDFHGARMAVAHLISRGHRRIATLRAQPRSLTGNALSRYNGYRHALEEAGIPNDRSIEIIVEDGYDFTSGYAAGKQMLRSGKFTALFAPTDMSALGIMKAARELGIKIPDDVALVGYCDQDAGIHCSPTLTTVDQKPAQIGKIAVQRILALIAGRRPEGPVHMMIQPELIVRESS